jgi:hypothetical protein
MDEVMDPSLVVLSTLPPELVFGIADHLKKRTDINSLSQTSRQLHAIANPYLYRRAVLSDDLALNQTLWVSIQAINPNAVRHWIQAGINIDQGALEVTIWERSRLSDYFEPQKTAEGQKCVDSRLKVLRGIIEMVLEAGADVDAASGPYGGWTALHVAAWTGDNEIIELLLCAGADIRRLDLGGQTILHKAAEGKANRGTVELLFQNGAAADINSWDLSGRTPLHAAAGAGNESVALFLLENGANVNASGYMSGTPLHETVKTRFHFWDITLAWSCTVSRMMKILLDHGADVDAVDNNGMTALAIVLGASYEHGDIVRCLLANRASIDLTDAFGQRVRGLSRGQRAYRGAKQVQWGFESLKKHLGRFSSLEWAKKKRVGVGPAS